MPRKSRKPPPKAKRRYSDDERATALAALVANDNNVQRTARELGIPEGTLRRWMTGERHPEAAQMSEQKKGPLADGFEAVAWQLIDGVTPDKIAMADVKELMTGAGIAADKVQLLRGKPTSITQHDFSELPDEEIDRRIEAEQRAIASAEDGKTAPMQRSADAGSSEGSAGQSA